MEGDEGARERRFRNAEREWLALEAWRGAGGYGLCYLVPLEGGRIPEGDREDRRALLGPGESLAGADEARLRRLLAEAVPLTETERRFADAGGRLWLAQGTGPVWAGGEVAAGLTGILFTALQGPAERHGAADGRLAGASAEELQARLERARRLAGEGGEKGASRGSGGA